LSPLNSNWFPQDATLLGRARGEQQQQNQLQMHVKIIRLEDQVYDLTNERAAFKKQQAEGDQIIRELQRDVAILKAQDQQHHGKLEVCKRGVDDSSKETRALEQRITAIPGNLEPQFQHHVTRIDKIEGLVRGVGTQTKQHAMQLGITETRVAQLEQNAGDMTTVKSYNHSHSQDGSEHSRGKSKLAWPKRSSLTAPVSQLTSSINKLEATQDKHESYLQTIGENMFAHQTGMDMVNSAMDDIRAKVEMLKTGYPGPHGNENSAPKSGLFKMDTTTNFVFMLQAKVDRLAEQPRRQGNGGESPGSDTSSTANDVERLLIQMDEVRGKISRMERDMVSGSCKTVSRPRLILGVQDMQHFLDDISLAHKLRLETIFYQLTKEYAGRCAPENIQFGLDVDRLFILRQRVLERLAVEDSVQCEFERLKKSQQMYS
jgi:chromosome segregation ATPase